MEQTRDCNKKKCSEQVKVIKNVCFFCEYSDSEMCNFLFIWEPF